MIEEWIIGMCMGWVFGAVFGYLFKEAIIEWNKSKEDEKKLCGDAGENPHPRLNLKEAKKNE